MPRRIYFSAAFAACLAAATGPALAQAVVSELVPVVAASNTLLVAGPSIMAAVTAAAAAQQPTVKFTTSSTLMAGPSAEAGQAACQPLRGDLAEITGAPQKAYGTEVFPLRVTSGRCAGTSGWAGAARIEAAGPASPASSSEGLQFSSSDSLFDSLEPKTVKASCQPLRGDGAEILESAKFAGTEVHRVAVLTGRCQGATGWVGAARLERAAAARSQ